MIVFKYKALILPLVLKVRTHYKGVVNKWKIANAASCTRPLWPAMHGFDMDYNSLLFHPLLNRALPQPLLIKLILLTIKYDSK